MLTYCSFAHRSSMRPANQACSTPLGRNSAQSSNCCATSSPVWVGRGASTTPSTLRVPLASTGVPSDLDIIVPRGLAVFRAGGSKQFFHGGLSPQELLIAVIVVDTQPAP